MNKVVPITGGCGHAMKKEAIRAFQASRARIPTRDRIQKANQKRMEKIRRDEMDY